MVSSPQVNSYRNAEPNIKREFLNGLQLKYTNGFLADISLPKRIVYREFQLRLIVLSSGDQWLPCIQNSQGHDRLLKRFSSGPRYTVRLIVRMKPGKTDWWCWTTSRFYHSDVPLVCRKMSDLWIFVLKSELKLRCLNLWSKTRL